MFSVLTNPVLPIFREIPVDQLCVTVSCRALCPGVMAVLRGTSLASTPKSATTTPGSGTP